MATAAAFFRTVDLATRNKEIGRTFHFLSSICLVFF